MQFILLRKGGKKIKAVVGQPICFINKAEGAASRRCFSRGFFEFFFFFFSIWGLYLGNTVSSCDTGSLNHAVHVVTHQTQACDSFWFLGNGCSLFVAFSLNLCTFSLLVCTFSLPVDMLDRVGVITVAVCDITQQLHWILWERNY